MSKKQAMLDYYTNVLQSMDCTIDENGFVSYHPTRSMPAEPITILNGLRLAIPTKYVLENLQSGGIVAFHPLSESILLGQSAVLQTTRQIANASLTHKVLSTMLGICTAISKQVKMTAVQTSYVNTLEKVDEKTVKALLKLMEVIDPDSQYRVVNIFLKHGGILADKQYKRVCTVSFPLYQELVNATDTVYGVKMRKQDIKVLIALLEVLFPNIGESNTYSFGTDTLVCPYFIALLGGFNNVVAQLNQTTELFHDIIEQFTDSAPYTDVSFISNIGDGTVFKDLIPALEHNRGLEVGKKTEEPEVAPVPVQQPAQVQQPVPVQPVPIPVQQPMYQQPMYPMHSLPQQGKRPNPYAGLIKNKIGSDTNLDEVKVSSQQNNNVSNQNDFMQAAYPAAVYGNPYMQQMPMQPIPVQQMPMQQPMMAPQMMPMPAYPQGVTMIPQQVPMYPQQMTGMGQPAIGSYPVGSAYPKFGAR